MNAVNNIYVAWFWLYNTILGAAILRLLLGLVQASFHDAPERVFKCISSSFKIMTMSLFVLFHNAIMGALISIFGDIRSAPTHFLVSSKGDFFFYPLNTFFAVTFIASCILGLVFERKLQALYDDKLVSLERIFMLKHENKKNMAKLFSASVALFVVLAFVGAALSK